jgi:predicted phage terminase large subunit-like protein
MGWTDAGDIVVLSVIRKRDTAGAIEELVLQTARMDKTYPGCSIVRVEQEPGSSGKFVTESYSRKLLGYNFEGIPATGPKSARAVPFAQAAKAGRVHLVDAPWVGDWLSEVEAFPQDSLHDDQVDSASLAFQTLTNTPAPAGATLGRGDLTRGASPYAAPRHVIGSR